LTSTSASYSSLAGAYFVKDAAGKKYYGVKARYVAVVNGTARKLTTKNATAEQDCPEACRGTQGAHVDAQGALRTSVSSARRTSPASRRRPQQPQRL
jgi:hypothetical protein